MSTDIAAQPSIGSRSPGVVKLPEDERTRLTADLAAARELFGTYDPDSPPWAIEPEIRRLERRLQAISDGRRAT